MRVGREVDVLCEMVTTEDLGEVCGDVLAKLLGELLVFLDGRKIEECLERKQVRIYVGKLDDVCLICVCLPEASGRYICQG